MRNHLKLATSAAMLAVMWQTGAQASPVLTLDFSDPVAIGPQAPGVWYPNSFYYTPSGFQTSGGRLIETISSADSQTNRSNAYGDEIYNFQGRMYDLPSGVIQVTADIYIPADWATTQERMGGMSTIIYTIHNARARPQLSQIVAEARYIAARKLRAVLS